MKIIKLEAENIKKLRAIEINPTGDVVSITGANGAGKTSVLDSIWWALAGATHIQAQPIRNGQKKAVIKLDLGEIIVERKFTEAGSTLIVENTQGARYPSPQTMLDALLGELSFDPLAFARMDPKNQFEELRRLVKLDIDITKVEQDIANAYAKRTQVNRDWKTKEAQAKAIVVIPDLPENPIDESALIDELTKAGQHNTDIEQRKGNREHAIESVKKHNNESVRFLAEAEEVVKETDRKIEELKEIAKRKIIYLKLQADDHLKDAKKLTAKLTAAGELPVPINVEDIRARLNEAQITNRAIAKRAERDRMQNDVDTLETESAKLTLFIEETEQTKRDAIARANMPVPGLSFKDGTVVFNDVPLEQVSSAEQLKISLGIAMAANPKLRVIRIRDGSLLDENSLKQIQAMATDNDYQIWIERVDTSGKIGIMIEDGAVVAVNK